jgi:[acyl-carrier-protein] S-malonyltransferase
VIANYNSPGQTVISGDVIAVERAMAGAKAAGARRVIPLNVSGAFHSPLMQVAEEGLAQQLGAVVFTTPDFPIVSNVTAEPVRDTTLARNLLVRQLTSPVRWTDDVRTMIAHGADGFVEVGPGNVLAGLVKRIDRAVSARTLGTAGEVRTFSEA